MSLPRRQALAAGAASLTIGLAGVWFGLPRPALADNPLDEASRAAEQVPFSGRLEIDWRDDGGSHKTMVNVHSAGGEVQVQGLSMAVATSNQRYLVDAGGWDLLSPGDPSSLGPFPPLTTKYQISESPGPYLDPPGRPTTEINLGNPQRPAERLYLDAATKLLLRREQFDDSGELVRVVSFVSLTFGSPNAMPKLSHTVDQRVRRIGARSLPAPYLDPAHLDQGYQRVGVLQAFDGIQVVYSDGLHGLSVFERPGRLNMASLPAGEQVRVGRWAGTRYVWAGGQVVTWQEPGSTYTVVADAPAAEVLAALDDLPAARQGSPWQRLRHGSRRVVQAVSGIW